MSCKGPFWELRAGEAAWSCSKDDPLIQCTLPNFREAEEEGDGLLGVQGGWRPAWRAHPP